MIEVEELTKRRGARAVVPALALCMLLRLLIGIWRITRRRGVST